MQKFVNCRPNCKDLVKQIVMHPSVSTWCFI